MDLPKTHASNLGSESGRTETGAPESQNSGLTEHGRPQQSPSNEEPRIASEEDIPLDGPDPEGQKMIEELAPETGQPAPPGT